MRVYQRVFVGLMLAVLLVGAAWSAGPARAEEQASPDKKRIVFITPERDAYHPFWSEFQNAMQAATESLGYKFDVRFSNNDHYEWLAAIKAAATEENKPDVIVTLVMKGRGKEALDILEEQKVHSFFVNAGLTEDQYTSLGNPREKYKYWLGEMMPNDEDAGEMLAGFLYDTAVQKGLADSKGHVTGIGVEANPSDGASIYRRAGLDKYVASQPGLNILQVVKGKWERHTAKSLTTHLLKRYENKINLVWSASDAMALGAAEAAAAAGMTPGKDILLAGVDWSTEGFDAIKEGTLAGSVGGHVMEGAWAAVILYDYFHGVDFAESEGLRMKSPMYVADSQNVDEIRSKINAENWKKIDYKQFSKFQHPEIKKYHFTLFDAPPAQP